MNALINFLLFQAGWFACVLGAAYGHAMAGAGVGLAIVVLHVLRAAQPRVELALALLVGVIGTLWDSALMLLGWLNYSSGLLLPYLAPIWMIALWMVFATTLNVSLRWLKTRPMLAIPLGAVGGPIAYYAGHALGAVGMPDMTLALAAQSIGWGMLMPLLVWLSTHLDGTSVTRHKVEPCLT
jgi:hypothetical protein